MKLFVWDFHGVLEKGTDDAVIEVTNLVLKMNGYDRQMTHEESLYLAGLRWHEYFSYLLPDTSDEECFRLQAASVDISHNNPSIALEKISLNEHADIVLDQIHKSEHTQILISNTLPDSLTMFVKHVNIEKYFQPEYRFGVCSTNEKHLTKIDFLNQFLEKSGPFESIISIGDSPGDMSLINENSCGIGYLYTHPWKKHREIKCHHKINDLRHVLKELEKRCN